MAVANRIAVAHGLTAPLSLSHVTQALGPSSGVVLTFVLYLGQTKLTPITSVSEVTQIAFPAARSIALPLTTLHDTSSTH